MSTPDEQNDLPERDPSSQQEPQGKLILGRDGPRNIQPDASRQPYQNPRGQSLHRQRASANVPPIAPIEPASRPSNVGDPSAPQAPRGESAGRKARPKKRFRTRHGCLAGCLGILVLLCIVGSSFLTTAQRVLAFGSAISTRQPLSTQSGYMLFGNFRTNLLMMGYGGGTHQGASLMDSMAVISLLPQSHHTTVVSVPRDLWVQIPSNSGNYGKINTAYQVGLGNGNDRVAGGDMAAQKVSEVTGLTVTNWLTINFEGFRDVINAIGGVDVYVPDAFNACYPANDDPNVNPNWTKIQFDKGMQHMDGSRAIAYARAREPVEVCGQGISENQAELTDFARSARQQIIMKATLSKVKQFSSWPHLYNAMDALQHTIYTNMSFADLSQFTLKMDLNTAHRVGLSNQNALMDSTSADGQAILSAKDNNWQGVTDYVNQNLYQ